MLKNKLDHFINVNNFSLSIMKRSSLQIKSEYISAQKGFMRSTPGASTVKLFTVVMN
jgi:hypothetical protein